MIDPKLFTVEKLLACMLDSMSGNVDHWRALAEIVPDYMPFYPSADTRPSTVVRILIDESAGDPGRFTYLRIGSRSHFWDMYGDDFSSPEAALLALLEAPVPPQLLKREVWSRRRALANAENR